MSSNNDTSIQEGPDHSPPRLPNGYVAQWDGSSRKFYYVEVATGKSSWDIPDAPSASVPVVEPTPQPEGGPFPVPAERGTAQPTEGDRNLLTSLASSALSGGSKPNKSSSPFGAIASSLLSGGSHGSQGHGSQGSNSIGGLAGKLVGSLLDSGKKPQNQQQQQSHQSQGAYTGQSSSHSSGGIAGFASSMLGGHHGSHQNTNYGYTSTGATGQYTGQAPAMTYQPPGQAHSATPQGSQPVNVHQAQSNTGQHAYPNNAHNPHQTYNGSTPASQSQYQQQSSQQPPYGVHPTAAQSTPSTPYSNTPQPAYGVSQPQGYSQQNPSFPPPPVSHSTHPNYGNQPQQPQQQYPPYPTQPHAQQQQPNYHTSTPGSSGQAQAYQQQHYPPPPPGGPPGYGSQFSHGAPPTTNQQQHY